MSARWKIALLAMLGLSTAACCSTKRASKGDDPKPEELDNVAEDPRVMLMYGVPFPEGQIARPVVDDEGAKATEDAVRFVDGSIVKPLSDEEAQRRIEKYSAEEQ